VIGDGSEVGSAGGSGVGRVKRSTILGGCPRSIGPGA
jgi:hypothetical protein